MSVDAVALIELLPGTNIECPGTPPIPPNDVSSSACEELDKVSEIKRKISDSGLGFMLSINSNISHDSIPKNLTVML